MSALHMEKITEHSKDFHRTESLYVRAFPANERTPICGLMRHDGHDFVGFYDKDENFCGFASLLTYGGITHILYFAIDEQYREHGYGSEALKLMHTLYPKTASSPTWSSTSLPPKTSPSATCAAHSTCATATPRPRYVTTGRASSTKF